MRQHASTVFALFTRMARSAQQPIIELAQPRLRDRILPVKPPGFPCRQPLSSATLFRGSLILLLILTACVLRAETSNSAVFTVSPEQCVWHAGDNTAWAAAGLNESGWLPYSKWSPSSLEPRVWIRCHVNLSSLENPPRPTLQIALYAAYEVYVDGRLIGSVGNLNTGIFTMNTIREWPLSGDSARPSVALRVTRRIVSMFPVGPVPPLEIHAGDESLLHDHLSGVVLAQVRPRLIPAICFSITGVLVIVLIPLWVNDRSRRELLLLFISCVFVPVIYLNYLAAAALVPYSVAAYALAYAIAGATANLTRVIFFFALARRRVPLVFWILIIVGNGVYPSVVMEFLLSPAQALRLNSVASHELEAIADVFRVLENVAPFAAFLPWSRLTTRMKPLAVLSMAWGAVMMLFFAVRFTSAHIPGIPDLQAHWGNAAADAEAVTILALVLALLFLLFREQQETAHERAILAGEMQAAQQVQSMLAPDLLDTLPGMHIEVAFHPIREVGGDFYTCRILPGNRQRMLIGDVSGKGAAAAMTAAVLIGAAQRRDDESPSALLAHLNQVLVDMRLGGFATCLCAELSKENVLTVANAGHLAPYRNGEEVEIESGLPLGIAPEAIYAESRIPLAPMDQLTFLSDGVVEAQSASGELFGFDRTRSISNDSAEDIARAAQAHGQHDDITVLTLSVAHVEVLHA